MKSEYQSCCYSAMYAFFLTAYCILLKKIDFKICHIDIIADLDDELESIQIFETNDKSSIITVDWHSTNKINNIYMLYKNQYSGLENESILDLVTADVIEEEYYLKDKRLSIAPSILSKQYCGIIEHEVNKLIQLKNLPNKPKEHLMRAQMTDHIKYNNIDLSVMSDELSYILKKLHQLRNDASHGEIINRKSYSILRKYKNLGLFSAISIEKLGLKSGKISSTIAEISDYMGLPKTKE